MNSTLYQSSNIILSTGFHALIIVMSVLAFPFIAKQPIDVPPLVSVELIEIGKSTNIPYAPKAKKIIEKVKENEKLASEQAPPKKVKKEKNKKVNLDKNKEAKELAPKKMPTPENKIKKIKKEKMDSVALPDKKKEKVQLEEEKKQKPSKEIKKDKSLVTNVEKTKPKLEDTKVKQASEFEKKELFDPNNIAALIDKSKEDFGETNKKSNKITQSQDSSMDFSKLTLSEEDALKAQIFGCWSIPLGLPYNENLLVRIKLKLKPDGTLIKTEILDHARMNMPGQGFFKVLAESALRAIQLCQPLKVPTSGYETWKELQLNFDAREMLGG